MRIEIGEVVTTVTAVDVSALLTPDVLQQIVDVVLRAVHEERAHEERLRVERRVTGGVAAERDMED